MIGVQALFREQTGLIPRLFCMSTNTEALGKPGSLPGPQPKEQKHYWQRFGGKFLLLSIVAHVLFFAIAAYCIIRIAVPSKAPVFMVAPVQAPSNAEVKHQQVMKDQLESAAAAPAAITRVAVQAPAPLTITNPDEISLAGKVVPATIVGNGDFPNPFAGNGNGTGISGNGPNGSGFPGIGTPIYHPGMLTGVFYDFKFTNGGQLAKDPGKDYAADITHFVMNGWNEGFLHSKYLRGSIPLYATQVFFPVIDSNEGPKNFKSPKPDSPGKWIVIYKGEVTPPQTGVYHFVAAGDDDMIIRFNGKNVLFHCEHIPTPAELQGEEYHYAGERLSYARSLPVSVEQGKSYPIEILIGDDIPFKTFAKVLIEKEGEKYGKDAAGGPILPVFSVDKVLVSGTETPAHLDGPLWMGTGRQPSMMDEVGGEDPLAPLH